MRAAPLLAERRISEKRFRSNLSSIAVEGRDNRDITDAS
jgi:hypothetical protein